jgi:arsenate reductase
MPLFPTRPPPGALGFPDPSAATGSAEERLAVFRRVRDAIAARIETFVRQDQEESAE